MFCWSNLFFLFGLNTTKWRTPSFTTLPRRKDDHSMFLASWYYTRWALKGQFNKRQADMKAGYRVDNDPASSSDSYYIHIDYCYLIIYLHLFFRIIFCCYVWFTYEYVLRNITSEQMNILLSFVFEFYIFR